MAALYGNRWKILDGPRLGQGGQSEVFRVTDARGDHAGEFALKRVLNPARQDRFRNEIDAIKRLQHPNIIRLIDHSALDDLENLADKQFLVMPLAKGGDLSKEGRVTLYKGALDGALQVAKQIASGLQEAHKNDVIHRDIKPQNILFTDMGHEIWISDFGICLLRDAERGTDTGEIVGPRNFMAPELEGGGQLQVLPAADIYSLGKVIYFMVSGGVVLPRERLSDPQYNKIFEVGQRFHLLHLLLTKMICPIAARLQNMTAVIRELEKIEAWELNARTISVGQTGLAAAEQIARRNLERQRVRSENTIAREQEGQTLTTVKESFTAWLRTELANVVEQLGTGLKLEVSDALLPTNDNTLTVQITDRRFYDSIGGLELQLDESDASVGRHHRLQLILCQEREFKVTIRSGKGLPPESIMPARDQKLALLPIYRQTMAHDHPRMSRLMGYFTSQSQIGTIRGQVNFPSIRTTRMQQTAPTLQRFRLELVTRSFYDGISQCAPFLASEWPSCDDRLRTALSEAVDSFMQFVNSNTQTIGQ